MTKDGIMTNKKKKIGVLLNHFLIKKEYFQSFLNYWKRKIDELEIVELSNERRMNIVENPCDKKQDEMTVWH